MKIAAAAGENSMCGLITGRFAEASHLIVIGIDEDTLHAELIKSMDIANQRENAAAMVVKENCEALISGVLEERDFNTLANQQVTRYNGGGLSVEIAVSEMHAGRLTLFTHTGNETGCGSHTHTCDCGEE